MEIKDRIELYDLALSSLWFGRRTICVAVFVSCVFVVLGASSAFADQTITTTSGTAEIHTCGGDEVGLVLCAQSFTVGAAGGTISSVTILLHKNASPVDNVVVSIQSNSGSNPDGVNLGGTGTSAMSGLPTTCSGGGTTFTLSSPATVSASTKYWVVISRSGAADNTNLFVSCGDNSDTYAGGDEGQYKSSAWTIESQDINLSLTIVAAASGRGVSKTVKRFWVWW